MHRISLCYGVGNYIEQWFSNRARAESDFHPQGTLLITGGDATGM